MTVERHALKRIHGDENDARVRVNVFLEIPPLDGVEHSRFVEIREIRKIIYAFLEE